MSAFPFARLTLPDDEDRIRLRAENEALAQRVRKLVDGMEANQKQAAARVRSAAACRAEVMQLLLEARKVDPEGRAETARAAAHAEALKEVANLERQAWVAEAARVKHEEEGRQFLEDKEKLRKELESLPTEVVAAHLLGAFPSGASS